MKFKKTIFLLVFLLSGAIAYYYINDERSAPSNFDIITVNRGDIKVEILSTGTVRPENRVEIKPPISGRIDRVLVQEGDQVSRGQTLAWMSSTERAALLDAARSRGPEEFERWQELYRATPVISPISGTIIRRNVEAGQSFSSGGEPILVMSDRLIVRAQVDETDISRIKRGQDVDITLDAYSNKVIKAKVDRIAYDAETTNNVTTYAINIYPTETPDFMRSGMTANVSFLIDERKDVVVIRNSALEREFGKTFLNVVNDDQGVTKTEVEIGITDGLYTEVVRGIESGEKIRVPSFSSGSNNRQRRGRPF